eukprot:315777-Rhodomonas_salina.2
MRRMEASGLSARYESILHTTHCCSRNAVPRQPTLIFPFPSFFSSCNRAAQNVSTLSDSATFNPLSSTW